MTIITKWNNWRKYSIVKTSIVDNAEDGIYFFSANAFGIKGKLPGGKHSWVSIKNSLGWTTYEITDIETLEVQGARYINTPVHLDKTIKQILVSNRDPSTLWFGNVPKVIHYCKDSIDFKWNTTLFPYSCDKIQLHKNNCNTYLSYLLWANNSKTTFRYIGFKSYKYWDKFYNV
jgi:hypothetical protein